MERRLSPREPRLNTRLSLRGPLNYLVVTVGGIFLWQILSSTTPLIPSPAATAAYLQATPPQLLFDSTFTTLFNSVAGFTLALLLSAAIAYLAYTSRAMRGIVSAYNTLIQSVSVLVWAIVAVMVFGVTSRIPPILVTAAVAHPIILSGMLGGMETVEKRYSLLVKILGLKPTEEFFEIILPGTIPHLAAAARSAIGVALRISVVAEAFGASGGIGYQIMYNYDIGIKEGVFAWGTLLVALMVVLDRLALAPLENWVRRWLS